MKQFRKIFSPDLSQGYFNYFKLNSPYEEI